MSQGNKFVELLKPLNIGRLQLKNRIVLSPMVSRLASEDGYVTDALIEYYSARARTGLGMVITEAQVIESTLERSAWRIAIDDDKYLLRLKEFAARIHDDGAKIVAQMNYPSVIKVPPNGELAQAGPSTIDMPDAHGGPSIKLREMSVEQIKAVEACYAAAGARVKKAGFDGIEVHGAHGYLLPRFISPVLNKRTDMYGGSPENRARFLTEVIQAIKGATGADFPVWCRVNAVEHHIPGGATIDDTVQICQVLQKAGADAIHVSSPFMWIMTPGCFVEWAAAIKKAVSIPVIVVGNLNLTMGEQILKEGKSDIIALGRALLSDAELVAKVLNGREEDVVPCIRCNKCLTETWAAGKLVCAVNPTLGRERETLKPAARAKQILVIGGGPGGMEAAIIAAKRGHKVVLVEKDNRLGGQLWPASKLSYKEPILPLIKYYEGQLKKLGVDVRLNTEASNKLIEQVKPDSIIAATGIEPMMPEIPGIKRENVVQAIDVLEGRAAVGNSIAVIGAEKVGCEVAELLAEKGKKVILMRRGDKIAGDSAVPYQTFIRHKLSDKGVTMLTGVKYKEINDQGVVVNDNQGKLTTIQADTIVIASGSRPNNRLFNQLKKKYPEVQCVGDCIEPRDIRTATAEAYDVASKI